MPASSSSPSQPGFGSGVRTLLMPYFYPAHRPRRTGRMPECPTMPTVLPRRRCRTRSAATSTGDRLLVLLHGYGARRAATCSRRPRRCARRGRGGLPARPPAPVGAGAAWTQTARPRACRRERARARRRGRARDAATAIADGRDAVGCPPARLLAGRRAGAAAAAAPRRSGSTASSCWRDSWRTPPPSGDVALAGGARAVFWGRGDADQVIAPDAIARTAALARRARRRDRPGLPGPGARHHAGRARGRRGVPRLTPALGGSPARAPRCRRQEADSPDHVLRARSFGAATREWFVGAFRAPTPAQEGAWAAIAKGQHALVVAPTGSGKTLAVVPLGDRPAGEPARGRPGRHPGALHLAAEGARRRRRAEPPQPAGRGHADREAARVRRRRGSGSACAPATRARPSGGRCRAIRPRSSSRRPSRCS